MDSQIIANIKIDLKCLKDNWTLLTPYIINKSGIVHIRCNKCNSAWYIKYDHISMTCSNCETKKKLKDFKFK